MIYRFRHILCLLVIVLAAGSSSGQTTQPLNPAIIEQITGAKPAFNKDENVLKVSFPRTDVKVTVDGTPMLPFMGLTTWAAFTPATGSNTMVMGDIVVFQDEVNPVLDVALAGGLSVTALHNHFFFDEPKVFFMHIEGEGTTEQLATDVRKVLDKVKEIRAANPQPQTTFGTGAISSPSTITTAPLIAILGGKPAEKDGMAKFVFGRTTKMSCGCDVGKEMGVNTWSAFMGSDTSAIVDGDFVTFDGELQPVLKSLRASGIRIVAIHSHMEGENPKAIFLHYWGVGPAVNLATGIKSALDLQKK